MTERAKIEDFHSALRTAFSRFKMEEAVIRADRDRSVAAGIAPAGVELGSMLERPTRRFLIDPMLRALDWEPDDPHRVTEEARSWAENGDRLYFDYLGLNQNRAPTLLVEAKGSDATAVRPPRAADVDSSKMAVLISEALGVLKAGSEAPGILVQWKEWLQDLQVYVRSFDAIARTTLRRVVITAGRWLIIFSDPIAAFVDHGAPEPSAIHCYISFEAILERHAEIYLLLARQRLTDTLPLTLTLAEALQVLDRTAFDAIYRGVVVATGISGGVRRQYPTRAVYPAIVLISGDRPFAAVDYTGDPVEEPRDAADLSSFLIELANRGNAFEDRVLSAFERRDLSASPLHAYPITVREAEIAEAFPAAPGSTAERVTAATPLRPQLVRETGERDAEHEYLVITGQSWFYKEASPFGANCDFHSFPAARKRGVAGSTGRFDRVANGFTISNDPQHCEHNDLQGMRSTRCQLDRIESHLCCRACVFHGVCWCTDELPRLPCGR